MARPVRWANWLAEFLEESGLEQRPRLVRGDNAFGNEAVSVNHEARLYKRREED